MRKERLKGALRPELYVPLPLKATRPHHHKEKPQNLNEKRPHMIIFNVSANFIHILSHHPCTTTTIDVKKSCWNIHFKKRF